MKIRADKSDVSRVKISADGVQYSSAQILSSSSAVYPTVTFRLKLTPELERLAEKVDRSADGTQEYDFYASINSYTASKTDNHLMLAVYYDDGDEELYMIELREEAKKALYERLDDQCRKKLGKSCEKLLKEAEKRLKNPAKER